MKICEILNVGTELLLGEILNTHAQFLSRELANIGIAVQRITTVGDNPQRLKEDVLQALGRSDLVLLTGGLGPTADDLTRETVAEALGLALQLDPEQLQKIQQFFTDRGLPFVESNRKQALVPEGALVLHNAYGTAPGLVISLPVPNNQLVILLPGPPFELQPMFREQLLPHLNPYASGVIVSHHVKTIALGESKMAELCADLLENPNPTVAPYAKEGQSYLRVSAAADTPEHAETLCLPVMNEIQKRLGTFVYGVDKDIEEVVMELLLSQGKTLAVAESCTGGGIAALLTKHPGASRVFEYGFVTYANRAKVQLLGVSEETLRTEGAVSAACAKEMAAGALRVSGADVALAVTGIAGPDSDGSQKPVGLIYFAATDGTHMLCEKLQTGRSHRSYNQTCAMIYALNFVRTLLLEN